LHSQAHSSNKLCAHRYSLLQPNLSSHSSSITIFSYHLLFRTLHCIILAATSASWKSRGLTFKGFIAPLTVFWCFPQIDCFLSVHSCQQKSISLKFSESQTGSDVRYSCHHNSSHFTFPILAHSCRFSVLHSLQSITPRIY